MNTAEKSDIGVVPKKEANNAGHQAVVQVLNQIYEETFLGFSYGFRPRRHQHKALDAIWVGITRRKVSWVLDADIRGFFV